MVSTSLTKWFNSHDPHHTLPIVSGLFRPSRWSAVDVVFAVAIMLIYRKLDRIESAGHVLSGLRALVRRMGDHGAPAGHDDAVELLIGFGEFESAAVDALHPRIDTVDSNTLALRRAGVLTGHVFYHSWRGGQEGRDGFGFRLNRLAEALDGLSAVAAALPGDLRIRAPEGYACYGLYPEVYLDAARDFHSRVRPERAVCIGLRSIGTGLASVVAAVLEELGCSVDSFTVRPRKDPFDRHLALSDRLEAQILSWHASHSHSCFLVIDEGPGLSGSSLCGAAQKLSELGVPDDRIVFFPSWESDGARFVSESARRRWGRHAKFVSSFEDVWIRSGRLGRRMDGALMDVSAGMWRRISYAESYDSGCGCDPDSPAESLYPAVHPQHERRKYLECSNPLKLVKFAGLGRYGRVKLARAEKLAEAGFCPAPVGFADGFLVTEWVRGRPLSVEDVEPALLDAMGRYLAFIANEFPASHRDGMSFDDTCEMIHRNVSLALGEEWAAKLVATSKLEEYGSVVDDARIVAVDGRMLPHEWLRTPRGYLKTDAVDHHADQFFPRCRDIAWDICGAGIEFALDRASFDHLVAVYAEHAMDPDLPRRLPFYSIAYLAYRLGYASFAAQDLAGTDDGGRFEVLAARYASRLKLEIAGFQNVER